MPALVGSLMNQFVDMLTRVEAPLASRWLSDWEQDFVRDLRERFDTREQAIDMGCQPWSPSVSQWNKLKEIVEKV